jgi:hypothetical protein
MLVYLKRKRKKKAASSRITEKVSAACIALHTQKEKKRYNNYNCWSRTNALATIA